MLEETKRLRDRDEFKNRLPGSNDPEKKEAGTYQITHDESGRFYVGSSVDCARRMTQHIGQLRRGEHPVKELQALYNQSPKFTFSHTRYGTPTQEGIESTIKTEEQLLLDQNAASDQLLNKASDSINSYQGLTHSDEARTKMAEAARGREKSEEERAKISESNRNRDPISDETRERMSSAKRGIISPGVVERLQPVSIDGVVYESMSEAARQLNLKHACVQYRLSSESEKFAGWKRI